MKNKSFNKLIKIDINKNHMENISVSTFFDGPIINILTYPQKLSYNTAIVGLHYYLCSVCTEYNCITLKITAFPGIKLIKLLTSYGCTSNDTRIDYFLNGRYSKFIKTNKLLKRKNIEFNVSIPVMSGLIMSLLINHLNNENDIQSMQTISALAIVCKTSYNFIVEKCSFVITSTNNRERCVKYYNRHCIKKPMYEINNDFKLFKYVDKFNDLHYLVNDNIIEICTFPILYYKFKNLKEINIFYPKMKLKYGRKKDDYQIIINEIKSCAENLGNGIFDQINISINRLVYSYCLPKKCKILNLSSKRVNHCIIYCEYNLFSCDTLHYNHIIDLITWRCLFRGGLSEKPVKLIGEKIETFFGFIDYCDIGGMKNLKVLKIWSINETTIDLQNFDKLEKIKLQSKCIVPINIPKNVKIKKYDYFM